MKNFLKSASAFVLMLGAAVMLFTACDKKGGNSGGNGDVDKTKLEALIIESAKHCSTERRPTTIRRPISKPSPMR